MNLLDYGFSNYDIKILNKKNEVVKKIDVDKANKNNISLVPLNDISVLEKKGSKGVKYSLEFKLNKINLPIDKGDVVGKVIVKNGKDKIREIPLTTSSRVYAYSYLELLFEGVKNIISGNILY